MSQGEMYFALHKFLLRTAGTGGADAPAGAVAVAGQVCSESIFYRAWPRLSGRAAVTEVEA